MSGKELVFIGALTLMTVTGSSGLAATQQAQDVTVCMNAKAPDNQIGGCTSAIQSGRWKGKEVAWAFYNRGRAYNDKRQYDLAILDFNEALKLTPNDADAFHSAFAYSGKGQTDRAIQDFDQAIQLYPNYVSAFINRGYAYYRENKYDRAIQDYDQAIKLDPNNAKTFVSRGSVYGGNGQHDRAIQDYDEAITLDPNNADALNNRCWSRTLTGQLDKAVLDCNESLRLRPGNGVTLDSRGLAYLKLGQFENAIADNDAAFKQNAMASSLYVRGLAKQKKGDQSGGQADIAAAKAIDDKIAETYAGYGVK